MYNIKTQSKKLALAFIIALLLIANIAIAAMAATGVAFAADENPWGYWDINDLEAGKSKINIGGMDWIVLDTNAAGYTADGKVEDADHRGILIQLDPTYAFDKQYSYGEYFSEHGKEYINHTLSYADGNSSWGITAQRESRNNVGTNLWEESSIKEFLNNEFLENFTPAEKLAILGNMPRQQLLWWGEAESNSGVANKDIVFYHDEFEVEDTEKYVGQVGTWANEFAHTAFENHTEGKMYRGGNTLATLKGNSDDALRYTAIDSVFLPGITELLNSKFSLDIGSDKLWTGIPDASHVEGGSRVLTVDIAGNITSEAVDSNNIKITPMMYLDQTTMFHSRSGDVFGDISNRDYNSFVDLIVGDYIRMGGERWRVVGLDANNGILVRKDRATESRPFDAPRPVDSMGKPLDTSRIAYNSVLINIETAFPGHTDRRRETNGSNFWQESDIRDYLNKEEGGFLDKFTSQEKASIATVTQKQNFWFGDLTSQRIRGANALTNGHAIGETVPNQPWIGADRHTSRFLDDDKESTTNGPDSTATGDRPWSIDEKVFYPSNMIWEANTYVDHFGYQSEYAKLPYYEINDKVFLPDMYQFKAIWDHSELRNARGYDYGHILDQDDKNIASFTRQPFMVGQSDDRRSAGLTGTALLVINDNDKNPDDTGAIFKTSNFQADISYGVAPMMYLNIGTNLTNLGVAEYNLNEKDAVRETKVDRGQGNTGSAFEGWREFSIYSDGNPSLDQIGNEDFSAAQVGKTLSLQLENGDYTVTGTTGMSFEGGRLSWTPTTKGTANFTITRNDTNYSKSFTVNVAEGEVIVGNKPDLRGFAGQPLSTVSLAGVNATNVPGTWTWKNPDETMTASTGTRLSNSYPANFVPSNSNYESKLDVLFEVQIEDTEIGDDVDKILASAAPLTATYNQYLSDINDQLQALVVDSDPALSVEWAVGEAQQISELGNITREATFRYTSDATKFVTRSVKITVSDRASELPSTEILNSIDKNVTYGETLSVVLERLQELEKQREPGVDEDGNQSENPLINGTFSVANVSTPVGNVGTQTHTFLFTNNGGGYSAKSFTLELTVAKADRNPDQIRQTEQRVEAFIAANSKALSGSKLSTVDLPTGFAWANGELLLGAEGTGTYDVTWLGYEDGSNNDSNIVNYNDKKISVTVTIVKEAPAGPPMLAIILGIVGGLVVIGAVVFFILKKKNSTGSKF